MICYGGTEWALQTTFLKDYGIRKTLDTCAKIVTAVKRAYKRIPEYQRNVALEAREKGYITTIYGYIRMLPFINSPNSSLRRSAERQAANTPIQGSAADIMKKAQNAVYDEIGRGTAYWTGQAGSEDVYDIMTAGQLYPLCHGKTDMIAQIHDEIIFEMDESPEVVERAWRWIKAEMEQPPIPDFPVPIETEASIGYSWGDKNAVEAWLEEWKGA